MVYLTTVDNPWNPFTNWDEWLAYDMKQGYYTCEKISRLAPISEALPDNINLEILDRAMEKLIKQKAISKSGEIVDYVKISDENPEKGR